MEVNPQQAQEALQDVESVARSIRARLSYGPTGAALILWGIVWIVCFAISQFAPRAGGWGWLVGDSLGIAGTFCLGRFHPQTQIVHSPSAQRLGRRVGWSWLFLFLYGTLWMFIFGPATGEKIATFIVTLVMFAYVLIGLLGEMPFMFWLGLAVTALACAGYVLSFWFPGYLPLWLGLTGGSALLGSGLYLSKRWK